MEHPGNISYDGRYASMFACYEGNQPPEGLKILINHQFFIAIPYGLEAKVPFYVIR